MQRWSANLHCTQLVSFDCYTGRQVNERSAWKMVWKSGRLAIRMQYDSEIERVQAPKRKESGQIGPREVDAERVGGQNHKIAWAVTRALK